MKKTILTVDDEIHILELLKYNLESNGYIVLQAETGEEAINILEKEDVNGIILDLMLPGISGLDVLKKIRQDAKLSELPVIMLTAKGEEFDKVLGLELGADDYIAKPFSVRELTARTKALLRRSSKDNEVNLNANDNNTSNIIEIDNIEINNTSRTVKVNGEELYMTLKEYDLLRFFVTNQNIAFSRDDLLEKIWGYDYEGETRTVDVHIRQLRKKIEIDDTNPKYIQTIRGIGYKFQRSI